MRRRPRATPRVQDTLKSPVIGASGVTFQLFAPKATEVTLRSEGPAPFANQPLVKGDSGVWKLTAQVPADLYIYWYDVDSVAVADPRNNQPRVNMTTVRSLLRVPGAESDFFAEKTVPHGTVSAVWYQSSALGVPRRMHVYTPPGYATSNTRYPVFYLLHGGGDTDQSWLMAGQANFILDNLIAEGKAKPMIVVMPAGHAPPRRRRRAARSTRPVPRRLREGRDAVRREELPRAAGTRAARRRRTLDGRTADAQHRAAQPRQVQPHRSLQLRVVR